MQHSSCGSFRKVRYRTLGRTLLAAGVSVAAALSAAPAWADTTTQPGAPLISSTTYTDTSQTAVVRTPGTFTFTPPQGTEAPTAYVYSLNEPPSTIPPSQPGWTAGGTLVTAAGGLTPTTVVITPHQTGPNTLYVYALDAAGNESQTSWYSFTAKPLPTPDPFGDVTGDGLPDALGVGPVASPGLWLAQATDAAGHVAQHLTQLGAGGLSIATNSTHTASDWVGAGVSTADFNGDGMQDLLVQVPRAPGEGNVEILYGGRDAPLPYAFGDTDTNFASFVGLPTVDGSAGYQTVDQIVAAPTGSLDGMPMPDLYAVVGDNLYLYTPIWGDYNAPVLVSSGWAGKTISAAVSGGNPALFARDDTSGALTLFVGDTAKGIPAGDPAGGRYLYAHSGFDARTVPALAGADINTDGVPDLWATSIKGGQLTVNAYLGTSLGHFAAPVVNPIS